jgi:tRNA U38,U39,U40 pseudouridine synthase TruA
MVGTLIEVGRGRWEPDHVLEILQGMDRSQAGPTAPARGLCLQWVKYPADSLTPHPDPPEQDEQKPAPRTHPEQTPQA